MDTGATLGILLAGMLVVVGGVLALRLHAFLALLLGALVVGVLTPASSVERYQLQKDAVPLVAYDAAGQSATLKLTEKQTRPGMLYVVARPNAETGRAEIVGSLSVERFADSQAVATLREGTAPQAGDLIVHPTSFTAAQKLANENVAERIATGFGNTCTNIGILIALASIVGVCLLKSGAADRIVRSSLKLTGEKGAPLAFLWSGYLLGIPVFFDTVFYLMVPLAKAMGLRNPKNYLLFVLAIVAGGSMSHSLVPPTPGPLLVAEQLGVSIGEMILAGLVVCAIVSLIGYATATVLNRRFPVPIRDTAEISLKELEEAANRSDAELPPLFLSLLPILLPVVLIGGYTFLDANSIQLGPVLQPWANVLGDKNIALGIAAAIAMGTLAWKKRASKAELAREVSASLESGGGIILITAAGGAFGAVLQQTGVANLVTSMPQSSPAMILTLAWLVTAAVRTAQGSATVAMITAVGMLSGVTQNLGCHPVYLALAIGCGSKPIPWMNDSGFWVITKMSGMSETEGLKTITPLLIVMGVLGLAVVLLLATLFPLTP